jgi:hypothetical protein
LEFVNGATVRAVSGTLSIGTLPYEQTGGTTALAGGVLDLAQPMAIDGGSLSGSGTISGSIVNGGLVRPDPTSGPLTITGSYRQTTHGTLAATIGGAVAGAGFSQLAVMGASTLAGTVSAAPTNGFTPAPGQTFAIIVGGSQTGRFTTLAGSPRSYEPVYRTTSTSLLFGVPWVASLSPSTGPAAGGTAVTIHGGGFAAGDIVEFGSARATSVTVVSATEIKATAPAHAAAGVHVTVTNAVGASGRSNADVFTYT